ncbi:helix-turn-helix domain-containing protein [Lysobacter sp. CA196]|uniref:helix-turn-helix domain-containing protein n=1 Tax=Lysobacter sp. CA196 TaxID=3455606 RepID=UPI003F8D7702
MRAEDLALMTRISSQATKDVRRQLANLRAQLASQRREILELRAVVAKFAATSGAERAACAQRGSDAGHPPVDGEALRRLRLSRKLTKKEFATLIGVSAASVHNWERTGATPSLRLARRIEALGLG